MRYESSHDPVMVTRQMCSTVCLEMETQAASRHIGSVGGGIKSGRGYDREHINCQKNKLWENCQDRTAMFRASLS